MKEDICSIPIHDIFALQEGCPFCAMRDMLEERLTTYITGAAMMEPDVRGETNRLGFCEIHFQQLAARGSKLTVALILESLLRELQGEIFSEINTQKALKKAAATVKQHTADCYICGQAGIQMHHLTQNMLQLWREDERFRSLYRAQSLICLPHYGQVLEEAAKVLRRRQLLEFAADSRKLAKDYLSGLEGEVTAICRMYDYRNSGKDFGGNRDADLRAMAYLTARKPEIRRKAEEKNR